MSKYNSKKVIVDSIIFDSKSESDYYKLLKKREEKGEITNLILQPVFEIQPAFKKDGRAFKAINYKADFQYFDVKLKKDIVVDVKGMATETANIKRKMFNYIYSDIDLIWVVKNKKYGDKTGWCEYDTLKALRRKNKNKK